MGVFMSGHWRWAVQVAKARNTFTLYYRCLSQSGGPPKWVVSFCLSCCTIPKQVSQKITSTVYGVWVWETCAILMACRQTFATNRTPKLRVRSAPKEPETLGPYQQAISRGNDEILELTYSKWVSHARPPGIHLLVGCH